jgi:hypothetical protein
MVLFVKTNNKSKDQILLGTHYKAKIKPFQAVVILVHHPDSSERTTLGLSAKFLSETWSFKPV